ncbi:MAG: tyrosine-type recombinase/integrase [Methylophilaceae bacterium]
MTTRKASAKSGKWTVKELEAITADWKGDTVSDGGGLVGEVRVNADGAIKIAFKYGFKLNGKKVWHYCGIYPDKSLADIRMSRDDAKLVVAKGIDPRVKKITDKILNREQQQEAIDRELKRKSESLTVKDMMDAWLEHGVKRKDGNKGIIQSFNKHLLPGIGDVEVRAVTEHHLIKIYKALIKQGKNVTAFELSKNVNQMIMWAEKRKPWRRLLIDGNPASLIEISKLLPQNFTKVRERTLSTDEIRKLNDIFNNSTQTYIESKNKFDTERPLKKEVQIAMWLCLSTLCRIGELLMTEWRHVDFDNRTWLIPAANTKGRVKNKTDHLVYLSDFALEKFKELFTLTGESKWAFPARYTNSHVCVKSASKQIGDRQLKFSKRTKKLKYRVENNSLVLGKREWTPHDLRRTGATMMQGLLGLEKGLLVTNLCLHHNVITGSAKHYLFETYEDEMREAWQKLGNRIEAILNAENLMSIDMQAA